MKNKARKGEEMLEEGNFYGVAREDLPAKVTFE